MAEHNPYPEKNTVAKKNSWGGYLIEANARILRFSIGNLFWLSGSGGR